MTGSDIVCAFATYGFAVSLKRFCLRLSAFICGVLAIVLACTNFLRFASLQFLRLQLAIDNTSQLIFCDIFSVFKDYFLRLRQALLFVHSLDDLCANCDNNCICLRSVTTSNSCANGALRTCSNISDDATS